MEESEQERVAAVAATPPVDVEVLSIALAAAEQERDALGSALEQERAAAQQAEERAAAHVEHRRQDAERYRQALLLNVPDVPPELVTGGTVDEVDASLAAARATVAAVRRHLAEHAAAARVPAGSPARGAADISALSPRQKIALALVGSSARIA